MTEITYAPEGVRLPTAENREYISSPAGLERAMKDGAILEAVVLMCDSRDMSLRLDLYGTRGIIPREECAYVEAGNEIRDIAIITRVGKPVAFKVLSVKTDADGKPTAILSRRAAQRECVQNYLSDLIPGDVIPACVTHLEPFGAFVDVGCGVVSLLSVDAISVSRIAHPADRFRVRDELRVVVRSIDKEARRIYVSYRELLGTWKENASLFSPGQTVAGIVRSVEEYGIFVELMPNLAGLAEWKENVTPGQSCAVYVKSILPERMKIKLVLIDASPVSLPPKERRIFLPENVRHIDRWLYSPPECPRVIESVFENA